MDLKASEACHSIIDYRLSISTKTKNDSRMFNFFPNSFEIEPGMSQQDELFFFGYIVPCYHSRYTPTTNSESLRGLGKSRCRRRADNAAVIHQNESSQRGFGQNLHELLVFKLAKKKGDKKSSWLDTVCSFIHLGFDVLSPRQLPKRKITFIMNITGEAEACACAWAEEEDRKQKKRPTCRPEDIEKSEPKREVR
jgi:hypothetical protein